jgi:hypothetical protein
MFGSICKWGLVLGLIPFFIQAQVPRDKQQHFYVGGIISGITYSVLDNKVDNKQLYVMGVSVVVGLGKELIDMREPDNKFDVVDWGATVLGGIVITKTINVFDGTNKRKRVTNNIKIY